MNIWKRLVLIGTLGAIAGIGVISLDPVNNTILKLALAGCIAGAWIGCLILSWKNRLLRRAALILPVLAAIPFILPGGKINADELRQNYVRRVTRFEPGYTRPVGTTGTVQEMDYGDLAPGDLAVTANGVHMLVYAGDGRWIQAAPGIGAVVTLDGRTDDNGWFRIPVTTHRWHVLTQRQE